MLFLILIACLFFSIQSNADEQSNIFTRIGIEEGLAPGNVNDIIQDSIGFIWIGTESGLCRYDGYKFKLFKSSIEDSTSLSFNHVFTLHHSKNDIIWIGTLGGGLNKFSTRTEKFIRYKSMENNPKYLSSDIVFKIFEDSKNKLWISTLGGGLNYFSPDEETFTRFSHIPDDDNSISSNMASAIFEDLNGNLWIGTFDKGLNFYDRRKNKFIHFKTDRADKHSINHNQIMDIIELSHDTLMIATFGGGINLLDIKSNKFTHFQNSEKFRFNTEHKNLRKLYDDGKNIWIGSYNGLYKYSKNNSKMEKFINDQNNPKSLNNNKIREIYKDRNGLIWIGTTNGANIFDPNRKRFEFHSFNGEYNKVLSEKITLPSSIINEKILWPNRDNDKTSIAGVQNRISYYKSSQVSEKFNRKVSINYYEDEYNTLWVGDYNGLKYYDKSKTQFYYVEFFNDNSTEQGNNFVKSFFIDSAGDFWAGTLGGGLTHFDVGRQELKRYIHLEEDSSSISDSRVMPILEDSQGSLWIGTYGGLNKFEKEYERFIHYVNKIGDDTSISNDRIFSIFESSTMDLWIGTYQGLNRYLRDGNKFERFTSDDGMLDNTVYSILEDNSGYLWLRTNKGISKFDPKSKIFKNYGKSDGLDEIESNGMLSFKDKQGRLFFGSVNGFYSFDPNSIIDFSKKPEVFFTQLKILDEEIEVGNSDYLKESLNHIDELKLSYKDKVFSILFSSSHFAIPSKNKYAYMLEGFRDTWTFVDANNRSASFTNLSPGSYTLHIKASNNDGIWNDVGKSLTITISPPYWETWWFRMAVVIIFLLIIFIIYEYRLNRLLEIERTRSKIARNLHDDVGGTLAGIQYFVDGIKKSRKGESIDKFLNLITESSNDAQDKIRDIIWTVNPKEDGLSKFFIKFKRHASDLFDSHNIEYKIDFPKADLEKNIGMEERQHLWCICKETVTNVIKHSKCKNVEISFALKNNRLIYEIKDDGIGFDKKLNPPGNGLTNIFFRAEKLNADCNIETKINMGFKLKLALHI